MTIKKKICVTVAVVIAAAAVCGGGYLLWKKLDKSSSDSTQKVYVQKVSDVNTALGSTAVESFAGVIEAQKSVDVKIDTTKTVSEILVSEGDSVSKGDKLVTYDVDAIKLQLEQGQLEVESMENDITTNKSQITELEEEMKNASADAQVSYKTQILSLESDNAKAEYDIKAKKVENDKLEASTKNAFVTASIDGTVKNLQNVTDMQNSENPDVIMQLSADGDYKVKGTVNEQNIMQVSEGTAVIIKSRVDDTQWNGTVSTLETSPETSSGYDMYDYGNTDESTQSSKYAFYVEPESLDGFMLGQHVLIELDYGQNEEIEKTGIWLNTDFICKDGDKNYIWTKNDDDKIEKQYIETGKSDEENGDIEITSGLSNDNYVAYPMDYIEEGMSTTTNESDISIPANDLGTGNDVDMNEYTDDGIYMGDEGTGDEVITGDETDPMMLSEEQTASMTDEEIEEYYNSLNGMTGDVAVSETDGE